jgi:hypothetical protein
MKFPAGKAGWVFLKGDVSPGQISTLLYCPHGQPEHRYRTLLVPFLDAETLLIQFQSQLDTITVLQRIVLVITFVMMMGLRRST